MDDELGEARDGLLVADIWLTGAGSSFSTTRVNELASFFLLVMALILSFLVVSWGMQFISWLLSMLVRELCMWVCNNTAFLFIFLSSDSLLFLLLFREHTSCTPYVAFHAWNSTAKFIEVNALSMRNPGTTRRFQGCAGRDKLSSIFLESKGQLEL